MNKAWKTLKATALKQTGKREENMRISDIEAGIQACIDAAWESQDPEHRKLQQTLFPAGKPTADELIFVLAARIKEQMN